MGYVYVAEAGKYCKIGISETSVDQRMKTLQTGCPEKIRRVWCSRNIPDHLECEKQLHDHFKTVNTSGEWFEVSFFEAAEEANRVCQNGADKELIQKLINENRNLKERLGEAITKEEIADAIVYLVKRSKEERFYGGMEVRSCRQD